MFKSYLGGRSHVAGTLVITELPKSFPPKHPPEDAEAWPIDSFRPGQLSGKCQFCVVAITPLMHSKFEKFGVANLEPLRDGRE